MDDDDEFYDTISVNSQLIGRRRGGSYMSLSRNTIYHSAMDIDVEMDVLASGDEAKVTAGPKTYSQWRDRNWRSFSEDNPIVDFVLAYEHDDAGNGRRERFERSLSEVGLLLRTEEVQNVNFLKIHVPRDVLLQYTEILKLRMPLKLNSQLIGRRRGGSYMSLSRNTIYHSAMDIDVEMDVLASGDEAKVTAGPKTYSQWRDRNWRSFSEDNPIVDFVLAYEHDDAGNGRRERFERSLSEVGLLLRTEEVQNVNFLKIHVPRDVLLQYTEILKLRMPLKLSSDCTPKTNVVTRFVGRCLDACGVKLDPDVFPVRKYNLTAEFSRDKQYLFDEKSPDYFNTSTRICVASYILERERYGDEHQDTGIKKLLAEGVYKAAYPLHDGTLHDNNSMRYKLLVHWASVSKWIKYQPIDEIKDYFGVKIALYFSWLGFYTHMLIPASIVGVFCFIYGVATLSSDRLSQDICTKNITMCPLCDRFCPFWELRETCIYSKISYLIDNPVTIFFAVFMSVWSALYLELWKRYSAEMAHRWGLTGFDLQAEPPRPEYLTKLANAKKEKLNVVTMLSEPVVPFWRVKLPSVILSFTVVLLWMLLVVGVGFGILMYRLSLVTSDTLYANRLSYRIYIVPITAGLINLVCIVVLNFLYNKLAMWLTEIELHRTQTEYEESLTLKIYLFQFVNYYSCIFYIVFLKGKFVGYPAKYNRIFGYRQEECQPGGCLMELTIQLAIIMIGNQALNSILEIVLPLLTKMYNKIRFQFDKKSDEEHVYTHNQWTDDYKLLDTEPHGLFNEYLEMVLQYGFVTIFVTAFPLAPLFALINNIFEMRLDAKKMIKYFRRPVPKRVKSIGVWQHIMNIICRISVVTNGFIIAFSSHFIPKLVYMLRINKSRTDEGYLNYTLSYFDTADFVNGTGPVDGLNPSNITVCRYAEFRNPPDHPAKYKRPIDYWHILAARLAFLVVYQNLVGFIITCIQAAIPDVPGKLSERIKREAYQINESIINREKETKKQTTPESILRDNRFPFVENQQNSEDQNGGLHRRHKDQTTNL